MKDYLLAELERSLFDLKRIPKENSRGIRQAKAHIRNVRNKLRAMHAGKKRGKSKENSELCKIPARFEKTRCKKLTFEV